MEQCLRTSTVILLVLMAVGTSCYSLHGLSTMFLGKLERHRRAETNSRGWNIQPRKSVEHHKRFRRSTDLQEPVISSMEINSKVSSRFSKTSVKSIMSNPTDMNNEAYFVLNIPDTAFISNFTMLIEGELLVAEVVSKEEADRRFDEAQKQNKTAGKVESDTGHEQSDPERGMEKFAVVINVKAFSGIELELTYLQLIERRLGTYDQVISIQPNQVVETLTAEVDVYDPAGIVTMEVIEPGTATSISSIETLSDQVKKVHYKPTQEQQTNSDKIRGINGTLVVKYDVHHGTDAGMVRVENNKYFAHYFSPDETKYDPVGKKIAFVIDISGSMSGTKMDQTRQAMQVILDQLNSMDYFLLVLFDDVVTYWPNDGQLVQASKNNVGRAQTYANDKLQADGSTNINDALVTACNMMLRNERAGPNMIVFLTDGEATAGETRPDRIIGNVMDASRNDLAIFTLGFGDNINVELLKNLAYQTGGFYKNIYTDSTVGSQLESFYAQISDPLMYDIEITYPPTVVNPDSLTKSRFRQFFKGSELVVVGELLQGLSDASNQWDVDLVCGTSNGPAVLQTTVDNQQASSIPTEAQSIHQENFLEKLYVYFKIKDLLKEALIANDSATQKRFEDQALQLALRYNLVTPLTSMIIVEPERRDDMYSENDYAYGSVSGTQSNFCPVVIYVVLIMCYMLHG